MRRALTLIELLLAVAIVSALCGALFPMLARSKGKERRTSCAANLSQIGRALQMYISDSDGYFPACADASDKFAPVGSMWSPSDRARIERMPLMQDALASYVKSPEEFHCPSDNGTRNLDTNLAVSFPTEPSLFNRYGSSYFMRTEFSLRSRTGKPPYTRAQYIPSPHVNLVFDAGGHWHAGIRPAERTDDPAIATDLTINYRYNVLHGDFHVKNVSYMQLQGLWQTRL